MSALYDIPRQFIISLAEGGTIHYTFAYAFVVNGFLCAFIIGPLLCGIDGRGQAHGVLLASRRQRRAHGRRDRRHHR
jgi:hypothetical protein